MTRKKRQPKILQTPEVDQPQIQVHMLDLSQLVESLAQNPEAITKVGREVSGNLYARAGTRTGEIRRRQRNPFGEMTAADKALFEAGGDLEKERRLISGLFPERIVPRQAGNDFQEHLLGILNRVGEQIGIPPLNRDQAMNLGGALRSMTDSQDMGPTKYEPTFNPERPYQDSPTVKIQLTWVNPTTDEPLFEMDPLIMSPGARIHLQPLTGWDKAKVIAEVVSIDPPGYQDSLQTQAPKPFVGQQEFHIRGLQGHFDFDGKRTTCIMSHPKNRVGEGLARCHPGDEYDLATGRKLSFSRALSQVVPNPAIRQLVWDDYFTQYPEDKTPRASR